MLATAAHYRMRPSDMLGIADPYAAFCLDEACALIWREMSGEQRKTPRFSGEKDDLLSFLRERK